MSKQDCVARCQLQPLAQFALNVHPFTCHTKKIYSYMACVPAIKSTWRHVARSTPSKHQCNTLISSCFTHSIWYIQYVQVCSYRCIATPESSQFEAFSLCIPCRHNCLDLNLQIPSRLNSSPVVRFIEQPLTDEIAEQLFIAWLGNCLSIYIFPRSTSMTFFIDWQTPVHISIMCSRDWA